MKGRFPSQEALVVSMANPNNRGFNTIQNSRVAGRRKNETLQMYTMLGVIGMAVLTIVLLVAMGVVGLVGRDDGKDNRPSGDKVEWASFTVTATDTVRGELILVNSSHAYTFPATNDHLIEIYNVWDKHRKDGFPYVLSGISKYMDKTTMSALDKMLTDFCTATGRDNVQVRDAYRSKEDQEGKSIPVGHSDHHTGLGVSLMYTKDGMMPAYDLSLDSAYNWLFENCHKYGFVIRYPDDKADITGVSDYNYYFRYVGVAHATYMKANGLCMEEYIEALKEYDHKKPLTLTGADGKSYEVYYVAVEGSATVSYPTNYAYSFSGTNEGGVVVTVDCSAPIQPTEGDTGADTSADSPEV